MQFVFKALLYIIVYYNPRWSDFVVTKNKVSTDLKYQFQPLHESVILYIRPNPQHSILLFLALVQLIASLIKGSI